MKKRRDIEALAKAPTLPGYDPVFDRYDTEVKRAIMANMNAEYEDIDYDPANLKWWLKRTHSTSIGVCKRRFSYNPAAEAGPVAEMARLICDVREWRARLDMLESWRRR